MELEWMLVKKGSVELHVLIVIVMCPDYRP